MGNVELRCRAYRADDREKLTQFANDVWGDDAETIVSRRWWWRYPTPPLEVVEDPASGEIVGMCAYIPFTLSVGGETRPAAWFVDFFVSASRRGQGIGKILTTAVHDAWPVTASLSQTDPAWHTFRRLGWSERRFVKVYASLSPIIPGARSWLRRVSARTTHRLGLTASEEPLTEETLGELFDESFDRLWERVRPNVVATVRDAATLRARYTSRSGRSGPGYRLLRWHRDDELVAYAIVGTYPPGAVRAASRLRVGVIVDYLLDPSHGELFRALVDASTAAAAERGARLVLCQTSVAELGRVLARRGFLHADLPIVGHRLSPLNAGFTYKSESTIEHETSPWFLTFGDCDAELTWRSRV